ncbi:copper chaperone PCu(A)C [Streptomyces sp. NBC_01408]|uniref:copper chaperone PCu(A)C n=1 Tax=Streptomyces sp. NBC_01408 TaxID=2903855 RepID=UPI00224FCFC4|nr:copper chaperone PCu(A)C [Streptomyces sp. NBC_01408]MCX4694761.1 copper chaperone PCu(A)C [Streptomyces sp. NBC_01408]
MTGSDRWAPAEDWRPTRRRLRGTFPAAAAPVIACLAALCGLTAWATAGAAGTPPRIEIGAARVFLPFADKENTAAFFQIHNRGGADDELVSVTSPAVERAMLSRHAGTGTGADTMAMTGPVTVPAGGTVAMSPFGLDVMVRVRARWQLGEAVPFVLHFRRSGPVEVVAFVVRPVS